MRRLLALGLVAGGLLLPSCAPKVVPPLPEGEDYVYPTPTVETGVSARERNALEKAWRKVLAGDVEGAVRDYRKILSRRPGGYVLLVEGGRIDHAHHLGNAHRALADTVAFSDAVQAALEPQDKQLRQAIAVIVIPVAENSDPLDGAAAAIQRHD